MIDKKIVAKSIEHYGADLQSTVCMEECAELIQAISKEKRGKSDKNHLTEEIADVTICLEMLMQIYEIPDSSVNHWIDVKMKRTEQRMENNE